MEGATVFISASTGAFLLTTGGLGIRLTWLARRTRHLPEQTSFDAGKLWSGTLRLPVAATYLWTCWESLCQWSMARRRQRLGLGDPVVANRFLVWGLVALSQLAVHAVSVSLHLRGVGLLTDPLGLFVVVVGGVLGAMLMFLAFLPPAAYLDFVRRRALSV